MTNATGDVSVDRFGGCVRTDCAEPCPWDMAAVVFDGETVCCSPTCARAVLDELTETPTIVTLHDPQGAADRTKVGLGADVVDIWRETEDSDDVRRAIDELEDLYPGAFRIGEGEK